MCAQESTAVIVKERAVEKEAGSQFRNNLLMLKEGGEVEVGVLLHVANYILPFALETLKHIIPISIIPLYSETVKATQCNYTEKSKKPKSTGEISISADFWHFEIKY